MPILAQLENGQFMMVYERDGGSSSGYVLSAVNDPTVWYAKDGAEKNTKDHQHLNWTMLFVSMEMAHPIDLPELGT